MKNFPRFDNRDLFLGLRKATLNPKVPMKPLYWTRILAPSEVDTVDAPSTALWTQIDELPLESLNEFADLFSRQVVTRTPTVKKQEQKTKVKAVKILDSKRSQNVGILAQSLHVDFQEIENAIYNFDTSIVNLEALQQIYEVVSIIIHRNHDTCYVKFISEGQLRRTKSHKKPLSDESTSTSRQTRAVFARPIRNSQLR